jgi:hypothetical protein
VQVLSWGRCPGRPIEMKIDVPRIGIFAGPGTAESLDGRTTAARRARALAEAFEAELGGTPMPLGDPDDWGGRPAIAAMMTTAA